MPKDWSVEDINRLVVMIKAINRDSQKKMYNIALVCDVAHISEVLAVLKKEKNCFVQPAFCHVENGIRGQNSGLVDSVQCVAVAYFGDSKRYLENFSSTEQNIWSTKTDRTSGHKPEGLYSQMITWFSHPGEWVLHFSDNESATGILAAVEVRRHCIFASGDMDHLAIIQDVLNAVMDMETEPDEN
ncbi:uncharacterized protein [Ptychodera flava]|uniref:uncharacterized protein isoform X2 n=1 Tax=Ptychodera flava TaxID=63121 RepID=UPI003969DEF4